MNSEREITKKLTKKMWKYPNQMNCVNRSRLSLVVEIVVTTKLYKTSLKNARRNVHRLILSKSMLTVNYSSLLREERHQIDGKKKFMNTHIRSHWRLNENLWTPWPSLLSLATISSKMISLNLFESLKFSIDRSSLVRGSKS